MNSLERGVESIIFNSRWLAAPFILGLIIGLAALLLKFIAKLGDFLWNLRAFPNTEALVGVLSLVDLALIANLILIVIFSSYENFIKPISPVARPDIPNGLVRIGFSLLKQKLLGSIVAISAVHVLERYMDTEHSVDRLALLSLVGAMVAFAVVMLIVAAADRVSETGGGQDH